MMVPLPWKIDRKLYDACQAHYGMFVQDTVLSVSFGRYPNIMAHFKAMLEDE